MLIGEESTGGNSSQLLTLALGRGDECKILVTWSRLVTQLRRQHLLENCWVKRSEEIALIDSDLQETQALGLAGHTFFHRPAPLVSVASRHLKLRRATAPAARDERIRGKFAARRSSWCWWSYYSSTVAIPRQGRSGPQWAAVCSWGEAAWPGLAGLAGERGKWRRLLVTK